jgi:hypothetical protein
MNFKIFLFIFLLILNSCIEKTITLKNKTDNYKNIFSNKGFTLQYTKKLNDNKTISNKINDRELIIFQKNLKKNTNVKITNLINNKSILAKVGKNSKYPNFYNSVVSKRIYTELSISETEPYIEITELVSNSSFIAKRAKTFEQEKNVATKAPVDEITIKDLSKKTKDLPKTIVTKFSYIIKIADFYFENSANSMTQKIITDTDIKEVKIKRINNTQFRVFLGPFENLNSLKKGFNAINILQFDNIEIIKN